MGVNSSRYHRRLAATHRPAVVLAGRVLVVNAVDAVGVTMPSCNLHVVLVLRRRGCCSARGGSGGRGHALGVGKGCG